MRKSRCSDIRIISTLKKVENGLKVDDTCRQYRVKPAIYCKRKSNYRDIAGTELKCVKKLCRIQQAKPTQNAFMERSNRTFRNEVFDAYTFRGRDEVCGHTWEWMTDYNEHPPYEALGRTPPTISSKKSERIYNLILSA